MNKSRTKEILWKSPKRKRTKREVRRMKMKDKKNNGKATCNGREKRENGNPEKNNGCHSSVLSEHSTLDERVVFLIENF